MNNQAHYPFGIHFRKLHNDVISHHRLISFFRNASSVIFHCEIRKADMTARYVRVAVYVQRNPSQISDVAVLNADVQ